MRQEIVNISQALAEMYTPEQITQLDLESELMDSLNVHIAYELLFELDSTVTLGRAKELLDLCNGNPWDVPIIFQMIQK